MARIRSKFGLNGYPLWLPAATNRKLQGANIFMLLPKSLTIIISLRKMTQLQFYDPIEQSVLDTQLVAHALETPWKLWKTLNFIFPYRMCGDIERWCWGSQGIHHIVLYYRNQFEAAFLESLYEVLGDVLVSPHLGIHGVIFTGNLLNYEFRISM